MPADAARAPGRLRRAARHLKAEALTVWFAARDPRTPLAARVLAACVAAYAFSPIDLIPDVIPVLGLLDDLILVPAGIWLVVPSCRRTSTPSVARGRRPRPSGP